MAQQQIMDKLSTVIGLCLKSVIINNLFHYLNAVYLKGSPVDDRVMSLINSQSCT